MEMWERRQKDQLEEWISVMEMDMGVHESQRDGHVQ